MTIKTPMENPRGRPPAAKISLHKKEQYRLLLIMPLIMLIMAFFYDSPSGLLSGLNEIRKSGDMLLTDYIAVGGMGAAILNSSLVTLFNILLLRKLSLKPNGLIISTIFLLTGFSFMGKNIFNIWPFYIGGYIYARFHDIDYKNVVLISMLSTTLSPLITLLVNVFQYGAAVSVFLSVIIGSFLGFVMPAVSSQVLMAHSGYSIYNMGFAGGLIGILVYALISSLGDPVAANFIISEGSQNGFMIFMIILFICMIIYGYHLNGSSFSGFRKLLLHSGRLVTDITRLDGLGLALVNMGSLGIIAILYTLIMGGSINGPTIAAILTVTGFGAFGKHMGNTLPILIGVALSSLIIHTDIPVTLIIITGLFGTTLAPIAGEFGTLAGLILGFFHLSLTLNIGALHGGVNLYNNGLSGGIIATLFVPVLLALKKGEQ